MWGSCGEERPLVGLFISPRLHQHQPPAPAGLSFLGVPAGPHPPPLPTPQLCRFLEPQGFGPGPGRRMAGSPSPSASRTSPFTHWQQSRGNAGRQLGTGARLCPPPAQPTSERGEGQAAPKKPLQDGALEILSTNYESGDKQGICKSISDRTFPGKSFVQAQLQTGPHAGSSCPSSCLCSAQGSGTEAGPMFCQPLCSRGCQTRSGHEAGGQGRALRRSAGGHCGPPLGCSRSGSWAPPAARAQGSCVECRGDGWPGPGGRAQQTGKSTSL